MENWQKNTPIKTLSRAVALLSSSRYMGIPELDIGYDAGLHRFLQCLGYTGRKTKTKTKQLHLWCFKVWDTSNV